MVHVKVGDYVTYIKGGYRRRGVITMVQHNYIWIRRVAVCISRRWQDNPASAGFRYRHGVVLNVLPLHKAAVYKLKGI